MSRIGVAAAGRDRDSGPGRPRASSRDVLEEAAFELFLEQGYDGTTVAQIARRAGVSRGTFFNYFPAKADVFWADVDEALDELPGRLRETAAVGDRADAIDAERGTVGAIRAALLALAAGFDARRVPWVLTHFEVIGRPGEVGASALARLSRAAAILRDFAVERGGGGIRDAASRTLAFAVVGAAVSSAYAWAEAGPRRGTLDAHLAEALTLVLDGALARP